MKIRQKKSLVPLNLIVTAGLAVLIVMMCFSITQGAADIPLKTVREAFLSFDSADSYHLMIIDLRLPRVLTSAFVGAALGVAGAIMQGITRNPMADSGILGINSGAGFAVALYFAFMPNLGYGGLIFCAFIGAAFGALLVFGITAAKRGNDTSMRLVLAGAAVSALLTALSQGIGLSFQVGVDVLFWTVGGVANAAWKQLSIIAPVITAALIGGILLGPSVSILNMGEDVAKGLGLKTGAVQGLCTVCVLALAGTSVAAVGAVAFVGLIIPHVSRFLVGVDYQKMIPASAVLGAILLVLADLGARVVSPPFEVPLGVITALIGVPFFLHLSRNERSGR